jgi:hypothetical protein
MSDFDFASELLGSKRKREDEAAPTEQVDFASQLISGRRALTPEVGGGRFPGLQEAITAISSPQMGADVGTAFVGGIPTDKQAAIKFFAEKRGLPTSRYRVVDGEIAYQADDGKFYKEIAGPSATAAYYAPDVMEAAPGLIAGTATAPLMLGGPLGMATSVGITGGTDAMSNLLRQLVSQQVSGQQVSPGQVALSGAIGGVAQSVPGIARVATERNLVRDIATMNRPEALALINKANRQGVFLTPAEITNLSSLMGQQKVVSNLPASTKTMQTMYQNREVNQIRPAVDNFLANISPVSDVAEAGAQGQRALLDAKTMLETERTAVTEPIYRDAFAQSVPVDVSPVIGKIDDYIKTAKGSQRSMLLKMKDLLYTDKPRLNEAGDVVMEKALDDRLPALQNAKFEIDKMFRDETFGSMDKKIQAQLTSLQQELVEQMGKENPAYIEANKAFAEASKPLDQFAQSKAGLSLSGISTDNLNQFSKRLFESNSVPAIRYAKDQIQKANPDAWDAVTRAYMQDVWTNAKTPAKNQRGMKLDTGNSWQNMLLGDENTRAAIRAALSPQQYTALTDLASVLEASARVQKLGSDTAFNQEIIKQMKQQAKGDPVAMAAGGVGTLLQPQNWGKMVSDWAVERRFANDADKIAQIITSPDGINRLKELRQMSPTSAQRWALTAQLLSRYGIIEQKD